MDTTTIRDLARRDLVAALDSVPGPKALLLDPELSGPLSLIAEFSLLKEHGVAKIYLLQTLRIDTDAPSFIYICRPKIQHMRTIAEQIRNTTSSGAKARHHLFFVPQRTSACIRELEEQGVYGDITIGDYNLDLVPLERDVLSLESTNAFKDLYLDGDTTCVYQLAKSIMKLQAVYGEIPRLVGKGDHAKMLADILQHSQAALMAGLEPTGTPAGQIDSMVILDRSVDLVTPMCMQLTYEGLVDELFGINATFVEVDASMVGSAQGPGTASQAPAQPASGKPRRVPLSASDPLYGQLRDMNFAVVGSTLSKTARRIHDNYEDRHSAKTMSEVREFVGRLGGLQAEHQSLRLHTNLAEQIAKVTGSTEFNGALEIQQNMLAGVTSSEQAEYVEEMVAKELQIEKVLRLVCLMSHIQNGLKPKVYDLLKREIIQSFGFKHIVTLQNLERSGLIRKLDLPNQPGYTSSLRKSLRLIVDDVNEQSPNDAAYVYSGYAPITIRLVETAFQKQDTTGSASKQAPALARRIPSWRGAEEVLKLVPGGQAFERELTASNQQHAEGGQSKTVIVVFIGGCTYTEISALRFLSQQSGGSRRFLVVTTNVICASRLVKSMYLVD